MRILTELQSFGYQIQLRGANIHLSFLGEGEPERERVIPLIQKIKEQKSEIVEYLRKREKEKQRELPCERCPAGAWWESPQGKGWHCFSYAYFYPVRGGKPKLCEDAIKDCGYRDNIETLRGMYRH